MTTIEQIILFASIFGISWILYLLVTGLVRWYFIGKINAQWKKMAERDKKASAHFKTMDELRKGKMPDLLGFFLSQQEYDSVKHLFTPEQRQKLKKRIKPTNLT